jgi:mercuric reductase
MTTSISNAVQRLNSQLPLKLRQAALPPWLARVHRATLTSLSEKGRPLITGELNELLEGSDVSAALAWLANDDLVVLNEAGTGIVGAYPMTTGPMFNAEVEINSHCHVTGTEIFIHMQGETLLEARPSPEVHVGVRWQNPTACAAHSMCLEMVFLKDQATALEWQAGDTENISLFNLEDAIAFGAGFFTPLLQD